MANAPAFRLSETTYKGACIFRLEGHFSRGAATTGFSNLFDRRVNEGNRYFVIDISKAEIIDSTGLQKLVGPSVRLSLRAGKCGVVYPSTGGVQNVLQSSKVITLPGFHATFDDALSEVLSEPIQGVEDRLEWEERLVIDSDNRVWDSCELLGELRKIRIFLASSEELRDDRDKFEIYVRQLNDDFVASGCYLVINRWENFLDTMSETRLQDEYNKAVKDCDIFVSLFCTKVGRFTEEEFDAAYGQFKSTDKPQIYTFFKKALLDIDSLPAEDFESLRAFKAKLKGLGHYPTSYNNIDDLKRQFRDQLDKLLAGPLRK